MKFRADVEEFARAASEIFRLTSDSSVVSPSIRLHVEEGDCWMAYESEVFVKARFSAEVDDNGEAAINLKRYMPMMGLLKEDKTFIISGNALKIKEGDHVGLSIPLRDLDTAVGDREIEVPWTNGMVDFSSVAVFTEDVGIRNGVTLANGLIASNDYYLHYTALAKVNLEMDDEVFYLPSSFACMLDDGWQFAILDGRFYAKKGNVFTSMTGLAAYRTVPAEKWLEVFEMVETCQNNATIASGKHLSETCLAMQRIFGVSQSQNSATVILETVDDHLLVTSVESQYGHAAQRIPLVSVEGGFRAVFRTFGLARSLGPFGSDQVTLSFLDNRNLALWSGGLIHTASSHDEAAITSAQEALNARYEKEAFAAQIPI